MEAKEAILDPFARDLDLTVVDGEVRYRQIGATIRGGLLIVAYTMRGETLRPVTAFNATRFAAKAYRAEGDR